MASFSVTAPVLAEDDELIIQDSTVDFIAGSRAFSTIQGNANTFTSNSNLLSVDHLNSTNFQVPSFIDYAKIDARPVKGQVYPR